jgi:4-carboxymuconolactone decarboxylase
MSTPRVRPATLPDDLPVHNNLVRTTYNNPEMHRGFASLSGRVHSASHLDARTRELVILSTAARLGAEYEWTNHVPGARAAGVTAEEIDALRAGDTAPFGGADLAALRYAAAVEERTVDDALWREASAAFSPVELLDMTMVVAFYGLASRLVLALDVALDD